MKPQGKKILTSKQLMQKIGITDESSNESHNLLEEEFELEGDLVPLLLDRYHQLTGVQHVLQAGMIVTWKSGLKNRRWPAYSKPGVVVKMLDSPVFDTDESGSTYYREPLDMIIGFFVDSGEHRGDFLVFHANSERYQPWSDERGLV